MNEKTKVSVVNTCMFKNLFVCILVDERIEMLFDLLVCECEGGAIILGVEG